MRQPHPDFQYFIVRGIRQNDTAVLREIYDRFLGRVVGWVRKNSGSEMDGHDLFQEGMEVVVVNAQKPDFILTAPFESFLWGICSRLWYKKLNKRNNTREMVRNLSVPVSIDKEETDAVVERALDGYFHRQLMERAFGQLGERCQRLLSMLLAGESTQAITQALDISANTFYKGKFDCTRKWEKLIKADPDFKDFNPNAL